MVYIILNKYLRKRKWVCELFNFADRIPLLGKVHGSLARAGKVRNQTPKVDKTERAKKRQTGRAKKRLQYKKRIINVDPNDKRKKGPNFGAGKKVEEVK